MPELPEVETTRRGIEPHVVGKTLSDIVVRETRLRWPIPDHLSKTLKGKRVLAASRRGKYLLLQFEHGHLIVHLGMSGSLRVAGRNEPLLKHDHVSLVLNKKQELRFNDPRRFGCMLWTQDNPEQHWLIEHLGPEPLGEQFNGEYLFGASRKRNVAVKNFLMDSKIVVGVGNIYANEALFLSGVRPRTAAGKVSRASYDNIANNIIKVLSNAIAMGGTTLKDFVGGDGKPGYFQQTLNVYDRKNAPCVNCKTPIKHIVVGQRSTYYCPCCQR